MLKSKTFSPSIELLFTCSKINANDDKITSLLSEVINWEQLIELARANQVVQLLYLNLKDKNIPPAILEKLKNQYQANLLHNIRIDAVQRKIFKLLKENNIEFMPLKGTVWAELIYGNIALRVTSDIDFLVSPKIKIIKLAISEKEPMMRSARD